MEIQLQTKVRHTPTHREGVVCPDLMNCCTPSETPVVFNGAISFEGVETTDLEILGAECAKADPAKCGAGRGSDCCIFLTCGPDGFHCERFSSLRFHLIMKNMSAKRHPAESYPNCQIFTEAQSTRDTI